MKNKINKNDSVWLLLMMEYNIKSEWERIERMKAQVNNFHDFLDNKVTQVKEDDVNNFHAFLDHKVTQAEDFVWQVEKSFKRVRQNYIDLGLLDASDLDYDI